MFVLFAPSYICWAILCQKIRKPNWSCNISRMTKSSIRIDSRHITILTMWSNTIRQFVIDYIIMIKYQNNNMYDISYIVHDDRFYSDDRRKYLSVANCNYSVSMV